jgi:sugar phosphate isomerase/epimerase
MAVEGEHMGYSIEQAFPFLKHIHFLDLDRDPPSQASRGIDLHLIFSTLKRLGYRHYLSMPLTKAGDEFATRDLLSSLRSLVDSV